MKIEIVDKEGNLITDFDLESNPFKVGETVNINVNNYDKDFWTVEEVRGGYRVDKIEHFVWKEYTYNQKVCCAFSVSVEVTKIE